MTVGMSAPPIGSTSSTPNASASTMRPGNRYVRLGIDHQHDRDDDRGGEQREIDHVLPAIHDRPRRNHFLQLARRDEAARAREIAEDDLDGNRAHAEGRQLVVLGPQEVLRRSDEAGGETAERVRQRGSLRHGRQRHPRQRNTRQRAEHQRNHDPAVSDDERMQQRADDGERHAADAGEHAAARGRRIAHPFEGEDEQRGRDEIDQLYELIDHFARPEPVEGRARAS